MKKINVRFEQDDSLDTIDIVIRAKERDERINSLIESLQQNEAVTLTVLDKDNCPCVIKETEIVFIVSDGKNVQIVTDHEKYRAKLSLQKIEEMVGSSFLRISRFEIINLKKVRKYDFVVVGTVRIEFVNGMEAWASRRYIPLIKKHISRKEGYLC